MLECDKKIIVSFHPPHLVNVARALMFSRYSRAGCPLRLLSSFVALFPRLLLDTEIWYQLIYTFNFAN